MKLFLKKVMKNDIINYKMINNVLLRSQILPVGSDKVFEISLHLA